MKVCDIRVQLDQVTGHEPCCEPEVAENLNKKPCRITARTTSRFDCLIRRVDTAFPSNQVTNLALHSLVQISKEVCGSKTVAVNRSKKITENRTEWCGLKKRLQFVFVPGFVAEWESFRVGLEKKIEWIDRCQLCSQVDLEKEPRRLSGEYESRQKVAGRILLPVDEMFFRFDAQRVVWDASSSMRRGVQPHELRRQRNRPIVVVRRFVIQSY